MREHDALFHSAVERVTKDFLKFTHYRWEDNLDDILLGRRLKSSNQEIIVKIGVREYEMYPDKENKVVIYLDGNIVCYLSKDRPDVAKNAFTKLVRLGYSNEDISSLGGIQRVLGNTLSGGYNFIKHNNPSWKHNRHVTKLVELEDIWMDQTEFSTSRLVRTNKRQMKKQLSKMGLI